MSIWKQQYIEVSAEVEFTDKEIIAAAEGMGMVHTNTLRPRDLMYALLEKQDGLGRDAIVAEMREECQRLGIAWPK